VCNKVFGNPSAWRLIVALLVLVPGELFCGFTLVVAFPKLTSS
jgi:hypothetical protein